MDALYVARLPAGPIIVLDGTAALIWTVACADEPGSIAARVAARVDRDVAEIAYAVDEFVADLVEQGLLIAAS